MKSIIRRATTHDAEPIASLHVASWRVTYAETLGAQAMDSIDVEAWTRRWRTRLEEQPDEITLVLVEGPKLLGFIHLGVASDATETPTAELKAIYLDPLVTGHGLGTRLHEAGLQALRLAGFKRSILWVEIRNSVARLFYERRGWTVIGSPQTKTVAGISLIAQCYERALSS